MSLFATLTSRNAAAWEAYTRHDFVRALGMGTLAGESFRHYLKQDYLFLIHFARAYGLAAYKSRSLDDIRAAGAGLMAMIDTEMGLHVRYCADWGISEAELQALPEASATMAYTRYVLERGMAGDLLDLHVALAPCIVGYAEIGQWLAEQDGPADNPYRSWIDLYAGEDYRRVAAAEVAYIDRLGAGISPARRDDLCRTFGEATRLEVDFWEMGLSLSN